MAFLELLPNDERIKEIVQLLGEKNAHFLAMLNKGFQRVGLDFIAKIQKEQMSGRTSPDRGLNVRTGNLRRSWFPLTNFSGEDLISTIFTDVKYAWAHQKPGGFDISMPARQRLIHFRKTKRGTRFASESSATPKTAGQIRKNYYSRVVEGKAYLIHIPKRLYVLEDFKESGIKMYADAIVDAYGEFKK